MRLSTIKGFYPYLGIVFLNAFVDLGHKILIQDTLYQTTSGHSYTIFSAIINALILLPYILLFTPSGFIADKFSKTRVLQFTALAAIPLTILITFCYYQGFFWGAFSLTFLLGIQSAINSPAKYGYIKEIFGKEHISQANALVQTLTILAILGGTFVFTLLFSHYIQGTLLTSSDKTILLKQFAPAGFLLIFFSTLECILTYLIPQKAPADPHSNYHMSTYLRGAYLKPYLSKASAHPTIMTCIIGLSLFWALNQVLLASYGAFLKDHIGEISVLFAQGSLAMGGIGILLGALYAGKVSKGFIETGLIPVGALGITFGLFLLPFMVSKLGIVFLFLLYGFFGGMLIVPLNALIQFNAGRSELGKILSANNFIQNCFMVSFLILTVISSEIGLSSIFILFTLAIIALVGTIYAFITLPQSLVRYLLYFVVSKFYAIRVYHLNHLPSTGGVLLLGNHISFIDWAILQIACPRPIRFVMERSIYEKWYLRWFLKRFQCIPISRGHSKEALQKVNETLNQGEVVGLFPEGRLSRNGQLGTFYSGFERAAKDAQAQIIPFYINGLWGAKSSYATDYYKRLAKLNNREISVIYGEPLPTDASAQDVQQKVRELSIQSWKYHCENQGSLQEVWLKKSKQCASALALIDSDNRNFSFHQLLATVLYFSRRWFATRKNEKVIGILLPTSAAGVIANLSVLSRGKTLVNLNYTAGEAAIRSAISQTGLTTIISSRAFLHALKEKGHSFNFSDLQIIYFEDSMRKSSPFWIAGYWLIAKILPLFLLQFLAIRKTPVDHTAVIIFSSGSEGTPKGIELSHQNILSNIMQVSHVFNLQPNDKMLNALPLFHAFGLTVTTFMPLIQGFPMVCYPDPTNTLAIAQRIYRHNITLLCATSTFLSLYIRNPKVHPLMLKSLRMVVAGAEKLSLAVYEAFKKKFNLDIYEGYGATEVSPVASCNLPDVLYPSDWHLVQTHKLGTVGLPLPGCAFRIVDPESYQALPIGTPGLILIGGTQVMKGYLNNESKTREVLLREGVFTWYKTGDKGYLDKDGFLTIVDRYSRFAKIGGEMQSLGQLEQQVEQFFPESNGGCMAIAIPDAKKGERILLLITGPLTSEEIKGYLLSSKLPKLLMPSEIILVEELPLLGNGKKDYVGAHARYIGQEVPD